MPIVKVRASTIIGEFEQAHTELVGKAVILIDGKADHADDAGTRRPMSHITSTLPVRSWCPLTRARLCENVREQRTRRIVFSLSSFDHDGQCCPFLIQRNRDKLSTRADRNLNAR